MHSKLSVAFLVLPILLTAIFPGVSAYAQPAARVPFSRRRSFQERGVIDIDLLRLHLQHGWMKILRGFDAYKANTGVAHPSDHGSRWTPVLRMPTKRATGNVSLTDDLNGTLWHGAVSVGTPLKKFAVDFDTGSSDFFLPGPACDFDCEGHMVYDPEESSTAINQNKTFSTHFGDGSIILGEVFTDTVSLAGLNGTGQGLVAATRYSERLNISVFPPDGLLGMAFPSIAQTGKLPVVQTLVAQGQIAQPMFGFTLFDGGGELILGGTDTTAFSGDLVFAPVINTNPPAYWEVLADGILVGPLPVVPRAHTAIIDTGSSLIRVDPQTARAIYADIPRAKDASETLGAGFYTVPCDDVPANISFVFSGAAFTLSSYSLNWGPTPTDPNECVCGIIGDAKGFWVMGDAFMINVYTEFDLGNMRVGLAPVVVP